MNDSPIGPRDALVTPNLSIARRTLMNGSTNGRLQHEFGALKVDYWEKKVITHVHWAFIFVSII